jgi:hypothetical protein
MEGALLGPGLRKQVWPSMGKLILHFQSQALAT